MKSVLRGLRHIAALPGLGDPGRGEWSRGRKDEAKVARISAAREGRMRRAREEAREHVSSELEPYLFGRQHDAFVVGWKRDAQRFTLTALDEDLSMLLERRYGLDRRREGMAFDLVFEGTDYVGWREERGDGSLVPYPAPRDFTFTEWISDTLLESETPGVRWALSLWHQTYNKGHFSGQKDLVLLVEAASLRVVERQREGWLARLGAGEIGVFERYLASRMELPLSHPAYDARIAALVGGGVD